MHKSILTLTITAALGSFASARFVEPRLLLEAPQARSSGGGKRPRRPTGIAAARRAAKKRRARRGR